MKDMVEELYHEWNKPEEGGPSVKFEGEGGGGDPSNIPLSPSSSSSSLSGSSSFKKHSKKTSFDFLLKLDVKSDFPIFDGELNAKNLDKWIKQLEVYCRIQKIVDDNAKIQLATLRLRGTTFIWWESRTQEDLLWSGKIISSWYEFIVALNNFFYPLGCMQQAIMDWKNLKQAKGQKYSKLYSII